MRLIQVSPEVTNTENLTPAQLIGWVNTCLQSKFTKLEEMCTGAGYCQFIHLLFPGSINLNKVKFNSESPADWVTNWYIFQKSWTKIGIDKYVPVHLLIKGVLQDNFDFLLWFRTLYKANFVDRNYDALAMRNFQPLPGSSNLMCSYNGSLMPPPPPFQPPSPPQLSSSPDCTSTGIQLWSDRNCWKYSRTSPLSERVAPALAYPSTSKVSAPTSPVTNKISRTCSPNSTNTNLLNASNPSSKAYSIICSSSERVGGSGGYSAIDDSSDIEIDNYSTWQTQNDSRASPSQFSKISEFSAENAENSITCSTLSRSLTALSETLISKSPLYFSTTEINVRSAAHPVISAAVCNNELKKLKEEIAALEKKVREQQAEIVHLQNSCYNYGRESIFYFGKLRAIEIMCERATSDSMDHILVRDLNFILRKEENREHSPGSSSGLTGSNSCSAAEEAPNST